MSDSPAPPRGKLVLVIGPSGVGKSVILKSLKERHPELVFPRSATTRPQREGEGDELYRFLTDAEFDALLKKDGVLEWAQVHGGARYGTLKDEILPAIEAGKTVVREVDVQGFESIRTNPLFGASPPKYKLISIFIVPESREQLIDRIKTRAPISDEELGRRVRSMDAELAVAPLCTVQVLNRQSRLNDTLRDVEEALEG